MCIRDRYKHLLTCLKTWRHPVICLVLLVYGGALQAGVAMPLPSTPRPVKVGVYANPPKIMLGDNGQPSGMLGDVLAVSYTHLDVYKRQG